MGMAQEDTYIVHVIGMDVEGHLPFRSSRFETSCMYIHGSQGAKFHNIVWGGEIVFFLFGGKKFLEMGNCYVHPFDSTGLSPNSFIPTRYLSLMSARQVCLYPHLPLKFLSTTMITPQNS